MTCKCGGMLIRFYYCNDLRATVAMCEKCGQWHRIRRAPDEQLEASPTPKAEPKSEPKQETWRDRPPMF